jgi:tetratricopeptide (TPR) repeat protein
VAVTAAFALNSIAQSTAKEWYEKGLLLKKEEKYKDAVNAFKKAVSLKADYGEAFFQLGWCYNELEMYDEALETLRKEEKLKPADPARTFFEIGYAYKGLKNDSEAIVYYSKAIDEDPVYSIVYKHRGYCYYRLKQYEKALEDFKSYAGLEFDEIDDPDFWYDKGWTENDLGKYKEAVSSLQKAVKLDDTFVEAYSELGYSHYRLRQNDDALRNYRIAIGINPKDYHSLFGIADVYFDNLDNHDSAMLYYEKGVAVNQKTKSAYYRLGWCYNEKERYADAIAALKKAIELDNNYYLALTELGYSYYKTEQCAEAFIHLDKVRSGSPKNELSRYYSGFCYHLKNDQPNLKKMMDELKAINTANALKYAETLAKYVK